MRYIANKVKDKIFVDGIKEMMMPDKEESVEVIIDTKEYDKKALEECIEAYAKERDQLVEKYNRDLKDMQDILDAINKI